MPESESKPKLIELIGPGTGQGWKAVLRNGKPAVVHEIPVPPAEATAAVPRLQRLFEHRHPALSPVLAWGTDQNGVWVAVEPNEGTPLSSILARGPLTPPAAAALGAAVLSGVAALHEAGIATRAGGREVPPITPFLPAGTVAPPATPTTAPTPPAQPAAPSPAAAPAPYIAPQHRDETPARAPASYDAPDRPLQTYPSMPAVTFPPAPAPTAPAASAPPAAEPRPSPPPVPTWSEAPARPSSPFDSPATTNASAPEPPAPAPEPPRPAPSFEPFPTPAPAPAPPFATSPPAPPPPVEAPPVEAPAAAPAQQAWTPLEAPAWKPGETVPAEPLGGGVAVVQTPPTAPPVPRAPISAPARKPSVARPPSRGGPSFERPPWLVPAAVAVVIVLLLGGLGVIVLANRGGGSVTGGVHTTPSANASTSPSRSSPSASPTTKGLLAVPTYGPASADGITKVQICTTASPCNIPGSSPETGPACELTSCKVEVAIYFSAVQKSVTVAYTMTFFDRCSGQTIDLPGTATTTPATGYIVAIPTDHLTVNIPGGAKSGAMVAAAQKPAVAYSAPLLVGADSC